MFITLYGLTHEEIEFIELNKLYLLDESNHIMS